MTHEELLRRIRLMPYDAIMLLTGKEMWKLTGCFDEELVREIVAKHRTPKGQRDAISTLKTTRIKALKELGRPVTGSPQYFEDWIFDIKTGVLIEVAPMERSELRNEHKKESAVEVPVEEASNLLARNAELIQRQEAHQSEEPAEEIEWHDKVRLELLLRLLEKDGTDMEEVVKVRVAEVMQCVTGLPISTCKNYCTNRDLSIKTHEKEILKLNSKLQAIGISILL